MKCAKCGSEMTDGGKIENEGMSFICEVDGKSIALPRVEGRPDVLICPACGRVRLYHKDRQVFSGRRQFGMH